MKARWLYTVVLALCLLSISTWTTSAQGPQPPAGPPDAVVLPFTPAQEWTGRGAAPTPSTASALTAPRRTPRATFGTPGLSYRYLQTFGTTESPYLAPGTTHLNSPSGLFVDGSNNVFVVEDHGYRVLEYTSAGANVLALGLPGLCLSGNTPTGYCTPQDVAVDSGGKFWVVDGGYRVVQYDAAGNFQQQLPAVDSNGRWSTGTDNYHFSWVTGIAFDPGTGKMFVADSNQSRVQVYTFSGGAPVYNSTIGVLNNAGGDTAHLNNPRRLAVDSTGRIYIADRGNNRILRCTYAAGWSCASFTTLGLNRPTGIAVTATNVFIADSNNSRVARCDLDGNCSAFITGLSSWPPDVAVDGLGNLYVSDPIHGVVRKYDATTGASLGVFAGTVDEPYQNDASHLFTPWGIAVGPDGSMYVAERYGYRLLKLDAAGALVWQKGQPGVPGSDASHLMTLEGKPALTAGGRLYLPDTGNNRIVIYDTNGNVAAPPVGSYGTDVYQFNNPAGIAIQPSSGDVYIVDRNNHRVQVYDSSLVYKTTLGTVGVYGTDATHFNQPYDVAFDAAGNAYIADSYNYRVQKCSVSGTAYTCTTFLGETNVSGSDFKHLGRVFGVGVDAAGRVYVAQDWNHRVDVFDASGAYLATIGGTWGKNTGQLRAPSSVAFDSAGNVYVADRDNQRVQKYAVGVPGWTQVNLNGFGERSNTNIHSLASFGGALYASTYNSTGGQIWKMTGKNSWSSAAPAGLGNALNVGMNALAPFNGQLYVGVRNDTDGASIHRSDGGGTWTPVVTGGLTEAANVGVYRMQVFNGQLYAGSAIWAGVHGAEIWRSPSGDAGTWTQVVTNGFDSPDNFIMRASAVHNGYLYFGTATYTNGATIWRSPSGDAGTWTQSMGGGFGSPPNGVIGGMVSFGGYLYASTIRYDSLGTEVWRCSVCDKTSSWEKVVDNGLNNPNTVGYTSNLQVYNGALYLVLGNGVTGMEVWRSSTGGSGTWTQVGFGGFGTSTNTQPYHSNVIVHNGLLYIGTNNTGSAAQVWQLAVPPVFLPLVTR